MSAVLTSALALTMPTTAAQAQQGKACPEGFEINRGVCQAEPTVTEIPAVPCPSSLIGYPVQQIDEDTCRTVTTDIAVVEDLCTHVSDGIVVVVVQVLRQAYCEFPTQGPQVIETCEIGVLNEESGLCEIKPGRGSA